MSTGCSDILQTGHDSSPKFLLPAIEEKTFVKHNLACIEMTEIALLSIQRK